MDAVAVVTKVGIPQRTGSGRLRVPPELRLRLVRLCLEEQYPLAVVSSESGVKPKSLLRWMARYQKEGEAGLQDRPRGNRQRKLPAAVTEKILALKQRNPHQGTRRISALLKRLFFLPGSHETVRQRLAEHGMGNEPTKAKPRHNLTRPRFFERSTPNQMWQTDIFTFRLGGAYAYLIGYIDDYSRFMTGLGLYRSQTAEHVLELYRRAVAEYNVPKEMLTDNGRQYTNWRGSSRFEGELKKDGVHHIRSRPHHPMTLGKIERFWKSIHEEFLCRAQFDSFDNATERIKMWVQYYNYRRPHQGIGGMCPAERFFEVQHELRKTLERGVAENVLEMALRGKPKTPFYMVGRMGGQSVVLRAEKGKLKMVVDEQGQQVLPEAEYELEDQGEDHGQTEEAGSRNGAEETEDSADSDEKADAQPQRAAEGAGSAVGVVGAAHPLGGVSGTGHSMDYLESVAAAAMEGMLQALESRVSLERGPALSPRLQQMLQKKAQSGFPLQKLQERLKDVQSPREPQLAAAGRQP
jgi:transposase InsO family protein